MTKPVRRVRAGRPPDVDEWVGMPDLIQFAGPEPEPDPATAPPKPSKRLGFFVFAAVCALALLGAATIAINLKT